MLFCVARTIGRRWCLAHITFTRAPNLATSGLVKQGQSTMLLAHFMTARMIDVLLAFHAPVLVQLHQLD